MAVEYIMMMDEVDQKFNEACYWSGVNDIKKYVAVVSEKITANGVIKEYSAEVIFSNSYVSAILYLSKKGFDDWLASVQKWGELLHVFDLSVVVAEELAVAVLTPQV